MNDILRRKLARGGPGQIANEGGAEAAWGIALARAIRVRAGLLAEVSRVVQARQSLVEFLEDLPSLSLLAILDGPGGGLGLVVISPDLTAAMIEVQTIGHVLVKAPLPRRPTRTDGAMISPIVDAAMQELTTLIETDPDAAWVGGFRYASFLEEPRPLNLLLDEASYRVLRADMVLPDGGRAGSIYLVLPAIGRGRMPPRSKPNPGPEINFTAALEEQVAQSQCVMEAVLTRITLPLRQVLALQEGEVLTLEDAALDQISLESQSFHLAQARLGQHRGMRALRLVHAAHFPDLEEEARPFELQLDAPEA